MKRIVAIHGIGKHDDGFHKAWEEKLRAALPHSQFTVEGLRWSDDQDKVADKYLAISDELRKVAGDFGLSQVAELQQSNGYRFAHDSLFDVFSYCRLHEMRNYLQTAALVKLRDLTRTDAESTVVVAHSLGCALTVHLGQLLRRLGGKIPLRGAVLLAPPLGIKSPFGAIPDPISVTPDSGPAPGPDRTHPVDDATRVQILRQVCINWQSSGVDSLHFVVNRNDIICSDVVFEFGGRRIDLIPFKTGFNPAERAMIEREADFHEVDFGKPSPQSLGGNHSVLSYLEQPIVASTLEMLLA